MNAASWDEVHQACLELLREYNPSQLAKIDHDVEGMREAFQRLAGDAPDPRSFVAGVYAAAGYWANVYERLVDSFTKASDGGRESQLVINGGQSALTLATKAMMGMSATAASLYESESGPRVDLEALLEEEGDG